MPCETAVTAHGLSTSAVSCIRRGLGRCTSYTGCTTKLLYACSYVINVAPSFCTSRACLCTRGSLPQRCHLRPAQTVPPTRKHRMRNRRGTIQGNGSCCVPRTIQTAEGACAAHGHNIGTAFPRGSCCGTKPLPLGRLHKLMH